jgi:hypothetical protein
MMIAIRIIFKYYNTLPKITPTTCDFVNGCKHGYKFCLAFPSQIMLNVPGMVLPKQRIIPQEPYNVNEVTKYKFENEFSVTCAVQY